MLTPAQTRILTQMRDHDRTLWRTGKSAGVSGSALVVWGADVDALVALKAVQPHIGGQTGLEATVYEISDLGRLMLEGVLT